jgi:hypothetical protein
VFERLVEDLGQRIINAKDTNYGMTALDYVCVLLSPSVCVCACVRASVRLCTCACVGAPSSLTLTHRTHTHTAHRTQVPTVILKQPSG